MSECQKLEQYLDKRLKTDSLSVYEQHWPTCSNCSAIINSMQFIQQKTELWIENKIPLDTDLKSRERLLLAAARHEQQNLIKLRWITSLTLKRITIPVVLVLAVLSWFLWSKGVQDWSYNNEQTALNLIVYNKASRNEILPEQVKGTALKTNINQSLQATLGPHRLGIDRNSYTKIQNATKQSCRLVLKKGTIAFDILPKKQMIKDSALLANPNYFVVQASGFEIRVLGTLFSVESVNEDKVLVKVASGIVAVHPQNGLEQVINAGESIEWSKQSAPKRTKINKQDRMKIFNLLETSNHLNRDAEVPPKLDKTNTNNSNQLLQQKPNKTKQYTQSRRRKISDWRSLVNKGYCTEAIPLLQKHVKKRKSDVEAWTNLADCLRKVKHWQQAVEAYRQVIKFGDTSAQNRARYLAADLLETKLHGLAEAAELLKAYLATHQEESVRTLEAAALMRLGRILLSLNQPKKAHIYLNKVIKRHPASSAANEARNLLKK